MSWFGFGKKTSNSDEETLGHSSQFSRESSPFDSNDSNGFDPNFGSSSIPSNSGGPNLTGAALEGLQQQIMMEQQKMAVYQVISKLSELAFDACVDRPGTSLSSSEERCVRGTVFKYMDTSEFVAGRFTRSK